MTLSLGWFSTGRGEGSRGLLKFVQDRNLRGDIPARIQFVFSNREQGEAEGSDQFFDLVRGYQVPLVTLSSRRFRRQVGGEFAGHRTEYDRQVGELLKDYSPHVCVLAGYMLIAGPELCRRYTLLNLHPALPNGPTGAWQQVIWALIEAQAKETGAMVHLATEEVDRGPALSYFTLSLRDSLFDPHWGQVVGQSVQRLKAQYGEELPLFRLIRQEEYRREPHLLAETLKAVASGEISTAARPAGAPRDRSNWGLCLNQRIERTLASE